MFCRTLLKRRWKAILQFVIGTIIGSFLAVVTTRIPWGESLLYPPSHCDLCQQKLRPLELIPLFSSLRQGFRCRHCHKKFSARSFWLELFCGVLFVLFLAEVNGVQLWQLFWLLSTLVLAVIDWDHFIVEKKIFFFTSLILLGGGALLFSFHWKQPLMVCALYYCSQKILPNSLGLGDLWIITLWSLFLSGHELLQLLLIASATGLGFYGYQVLRQKIPERLPFVPFLFIGLFCILLDHR